MENLAHLAFKSENTFGRALPPELDRDSSLYDWMNPFGIDTIKIKYSKALRRLSGKTQVISRNLILDANSSSPIIGQVNKHIRDRLFHSLEVSALVEQIGRRLELNVPLLSASGLGHDLGHVIFGHLGEEFIAERLNDSFRHEKFVIFVLEMIERDGKGLDLSYEVLHAIRHHSRGSGVMIKRGQMLEDDLLMYCDKLSYIFSDYNDIMRTNLSALTTPIELNKLGNNQTERLYNCARALCLESVEKQAISFVDSEEARCFKAVRNFMYNEVYHNLDESYLKDMSNKIFDFFERYYKNPRLSALAMALMSEEGAYTLNSLIGQYTDKFIMKKLKDEAQFAIAEFLPHIPKWADLDFCNPDRFLDKKNFGKIPKEILFSK